MHTFGTIRIQILKLNQNDYLHISILIEKKEKERERTLLVRKKRLERNQSLDLEIYGDLTRVYLYTDTLHRLKSNIDTFKRVYLVASVHIAHLEIPGSIKPLANTKTTMRTNRFI